ncbi:MAG: (Fe-S)-binding protein [Elusimicrobiota bacterium]|jgi:glycolate oxidase iron-sulfur subunit
MSEQLGKLLTSLGERSDYDAVSQCSRCGYCEQACPTYVASGREAYSARGRNQLVRLMLEGKVERTACAQEAFSTCLLCGACTEVCPAHVPTADIVLEGRRELAGSAPGWLWKGLSALLLGPRVRLERVLGLAYFFKRLGFSRLAGRLGLLRLLGLRALEEADRHVEEVPDSLLGPLLRADPELAPRADARHHYFASCGPDFLFPRVGLATTRILKTLGPADYRGNPCCGLLAYNYGDLATARELARRNIVLFEQADDGAPVVADCSSCAAFLKSYPQLFLDDAEWRPRAERFAGSVLDAVELEPSLPPRTLKGTLAFHDSCRASHGQGLRAQPRRVLAPAAEAVREMPDSDVCCGGAGLFAFKHPELSEKLLLRKVSAAAHVQARVVSASGTSCLLQLARGLRKYYPEARVAHWSELVCEALDMDKAHG